MKFRVEEVQVLKVSSREYNNKTYFNVLFFYDGAIYSASCSQAVYDAFKGNRKSVSVNLEVQVFSVQNAFGRYRLHVPALVR